MESKSLKPSQITLAILGGGQLSRMLALACYELGVRPLVVASTEQDCALEVTSHYCFFGDEKWSEVVNREATVATIESEFMDLELLRRLLRIPLFPEVKTLEKIQSKLNQKRFLKKWRIPTLDFIEVKSVDEIHTKAFHFGAKSVFKQAENGYDGKGTFVLTGGNLKSQLEKIRKQPTGYLEPFVPFEKEISVLVSRSSAGEVRAFPVIDTKQESGVCAWAKCPSDLRTSLQRKAVEIGTDVVKKFGCVGVTAIEMFVLKSGEIVVNEIAPRVHNSGHLTMNGFRSSQFEQHIRSILGWRLDDAEGFDSSAMVNILGEREGSFEGNCSIKKGYQYWIHWYGKKGSYLNRKLGHINVSGPKANVALKEAVKIRRKLKV